VSLQPAETHSSRGRPASPSTSLSGRSLLFPVYPDSLPRTLLLGCLGWLTSPFLMFANEPIIYRMLVSLVVFVVASLLTARPSEECMRTWENKLGGSGTAP
jgi:hypothetical protein